MKKAGTKSLAGSRKAVIFIVAIMVLPHLSGIASPQLDFTPYSFSTPELVDAGNTLVLLHYPSGLAVDGSTNIYVADTFNGVIRKLTPAGNRWLSTNLLSGLNYPDGVAVDNSNHVYVADTLNGVIRKLTPTGGSWVKTTLPGSFSNPTSVAVDTNGTVYIAQYGSSVIGKITAAGTVSVLAGLANTPGTNDGTGSSARFSSPTGVAVDRAGNVYVADTGNDTIRLVTPGGVVSTLAGLARSPGGQDGTNAVAQFNAPSGVAVDQATNIYVADAGNDTIRRVTPAGVVTTLGGLPNLAGNTDGAGNAARFSAPQAIAVTAGGAVYVADTDNSLVRTGQLVVNVPAIVASSVVFSGNHLNFNLTGTAGQLVVVQASTNLTNWVPLWTNTFSTDILTFTDPRSGTLPESFYRALAP